MSSADKHFCHPKYTQDEWDSAQYEIARLSQINSELVAWIAKRKNKIHPTDPIHEFLKKVAK